MLDNVPKIPLKYTSLYCTYSYLDFFNLTDGIMESDMLTQVKSRTIFPLFLSLLQPSNVQNLERKGSVLDIPSIKNNSLKLFHIKQQWFLVKIGNLGLIYFSDGGTSRKATVCLVFRQWHDDKRHCNCRKSKQSKDNVWLNPFLTIIICCHCPLILQGYVALKAINFDCSVVDLNWCL